MKATKKLRGLLGISQKEMAALLSIPRSQLTMYENGHRDLPIPALLRLADIEIFCNDQEGKTNNLHPHIQQHISKAEHLLENYAKEQEYKHALAERNLKLLEIAHAQKLVVLNLVNHLKLLNRVPGADSFLNVIEAKALAGIEKTGLHQQVIQQVRISGLLHELNYARSLQQKIGRKTTEKSVEIPITPH